MLNFRLVEKFIVHNQLEKAERLRKLTSMFLDKQLSNTYEGVHHSILRLLVDMSKDSLSKSIMLDDSITKREARVKIESAEEVIKVREMLKKMDEELDPRKDTAEEDSSLDDVMDEEGFTSDKGDLGHRGNKKTTDAQARIEEKLDKINSVRKPIQSHVYSTENMSSNMFFGGLPLVSDSRLN